MDFMLPFPVKVSVEKISYGQKIFLLGSCFAEEIGSLMSDAKFDVLQNPNGILYDPASIAFALKSYVDNKKYEPDNLFLQDEIWHSWQHHSKFSGIDRNTVLDEINASRVQANLHLKNASWLLITLGTSFHYQLKETGEFVANCHKAPGSFFWKKFMPVEDILLNLSEALKKVRSLNPTLKIIFTISPVRHVRDGIIENNRSKARLIEAVHALSEKEENVFYFPAYELVIDVLRDYRFYKTDLVHVSEAAVSYVFEKFCEVYLDDVSKGLMEEVSSLMAAFRHKPFERESSKHKKFLEAQRIKALDLQEKLPAIDLSREIKYFSEK